MSEFRAIDIPDEPNVRVTFNDGATTHSVKRMLTKSNDTGSADFIIETTDGEIFNFTNARPVGLGKKSAQKVLDSNLTFTPIYYPNELVKRMAEKLLKTFKGHH